MSNLGEVSETLYVPMGGRIYASERFPNVFYDSKALELKLCIPKEALNDKRQSQYTFMASASRCKNIDNCIKHFLKRNPSGIIVELGCGLETTYFRMDNGQARWYELDLPEVIKFRKNIIPCQERMTLLKASAFDVNWMDSLSKTVGRHPVLFVASGVFQYFEEDQVLQLFRDLQRFQNAQIVFDAVSRLGMNGTRKYMKQLGRDSAVMYFYCNKASKLVAKTGQGIYVINEKDFYRSINKTGMNFMTRISMTVSDCMHMVKVVELRLSGDCMLEKIN